MGKNSTAIQKISAADAIVSLGQAIRRAWPAIIAFFSGGGMSYLASLNPALSPLAWGAVGLATFAGIYLILIAGVATWSWAAEKRAIARASDRSLGTATVNTLDPFFQKKRINIRDFIHPFNRLHKDQSFTDCEIFGPGAMTFTGSPHLDGIHFFNCDFVIVRQGAMATAGVAAFDSPKFIGTAFYNVTFYLTPPDARNFAGALPAGKLNIISDGTYGEI